MEMQALAYIMRRFACTDDHDLLSREILSGLEFGSIQDLACELGLVDGVSLLLQYAVITTRAMHLAPNNRSFYLSAPKSDRTDDVVDGQGSYTPILAFDLDLPLQRIGVLLDILNRCRGPNIKLKVDCVVFKPVS